MAVPSGGMVSVAFVVFVAMMTIFLLVLVVVALSRQLSELLCC